MSPSKFPIRVALWCLIVLLPFSCYLIVLLIRRQSSTRSLVPRCVFPLALYLIGSAFVAISAILELSATHRSLDEVIRRVFELCGRSMATVALILLLQSILFRPLHDHSLNRESFLPRFASNLTLNESNPKPPSLVSYVVSLLPLFGSLFATLRILGEVIPSLDRIPVLLDPILQLCVSLGALPYILVLFRSFPCNIGLFILMVGQTLSIASYAIDIANKSSGFPRGSSTGLECARLFCVLVWFLSNLLSVFLIHRHNSLLEYLAVLSKRSNASDLTSSRTIATKSTSMAQLVGPTPASQIHHDLTTGASHSRNTIHTPSSSTIHEIVSCTVDPRRMSRKGSSPDMRTARNRNTAIVHPFGLHATTSCRYVVADNAGTLVKTSSLPPADDFLSMLDTDPFASVPPSPVTSFTFVSQSSITRSFVPCPPSPLQPVTKGVSSPTTSASPTDRGRPIVGCTPPKHSESYSSVPGNAQNPPISISGTTNRGGVPLRRTVSDSMLMWNDRLASATDTGHNHALLIHKPSKSIGSAHIKGDQTGDVSLLASPVQNALDPPHFLPVSDTVSLSTKHDEEEENGIGRRNREARARRLGLGLPILAPTQSSASSEITIIESKVGRKNHPEYPRKSESLSSDRYNYRTPHPDSPFRSKISDATPPLSRPLSMIFAGFPSPTTASSSTNQKSVRRRYSDMRELSMPPRSRTERFPIQLGDLPPSSLPLENSSTISTPLGRPPSSTRLADWEKTTGTVGPSPPPSRQTPTPTKRRPAALNLEKIKLFEKDPGPGTDASSNSTPTFSPRGSVHSAIAGGLRQLEGQVFGSNTVAMTNRSSTVSMQLTASSTRSGSMSTLASSMPTKSFSTRRASSENSSHPAPVSVEAFGSLEEPPIVSGIPSYDVPVSRASNWTEGDRKPSLTPSVRTFLSFDSNGSSGSPRHRATSLSSSPPVSTSPPGSNSHMNAGIGLNVSLPESLFGSPTFAAQSRSRLNTSDPPLGSRHTRPQVVHVGEQSPTPSTYFTASPTPATPFSASESSTSSTPSSLAIATPQTTFFAPGTPRYTPGFGVASSSLMKDPQAPTAEISMTHPAVLGVSSTAPSNVKNHSAVGGGESRFSFFGFESLRPRTPQERVTNKISTTTKSQPRRLNTSHSARSDLAFEMQEFRVLSPDGEDRSFRRDFGLMDPADLDTGQSSTRGQGLDLDFDFEELGLRF